MDEPKHSTVENAENTHKQDRQEIKREIVDFVKLIVWFLVIILGLRTYVVEGYEVQGESMEPNLRSQERILVLKLPHILSQVGFFRSIDAIEPGDIVVFDSPDNPDKRYVKRAIAMGPKAYNRKTVDAGSETNTVSAEDSVIVHFDHGTVYVNNHIIEETYLLPEAHQSLDVQNLVLGPGDIYVLGDNREVSKDSRSFEAIHDSMIVGKAVLRFWPPQRIGLVK